MHFPNTTRLNGGNVFEMAFFHLVNDTAKKKKRKEKRACSFVGFLHLHYTDFVSRRKQGIEAIFLRAISYKSQ